MKALIQSNIDRPKKNRFKTAIRTVAGVSLLALVTMSFVVPAYGQPTKDNTQVAELDQLAADFHGALSYHGNITNMMALWADDSTFTFNGTAHVGKDAIQALFQGSGYFLNNWVSLAPEYKTQITIDGNTATITTQCVAVDLSVSPMVVKSVIQVNATCQKINGTWLFTTMNNTTPAPL